MDMDNDEEELKVKPKLSDAPLLDGSTASILSDASDYESVKSAASIKSHSRTVTEVENLSFSSTDIYIMLIYIKTIQLLIGIHSFQLF